MKDCFKDLFESFIFTLFFLGIIVFTCFACFSLYEVLILKNMNVLGFFGSIIGGAFTLIGVILTINFEKKSRYESEYPILIVCTDQTDYKITHPYGKKNRLKINLKIKNVGNLEASYCNIKLTFFRDYKEYYDNRITFLPKDHSTIIPITFVETNPNNAIYPFMFKIELVYYGHKEMIYTSTFIIRIRYERDGWSLQTLSSNFNNQ